MNDDMQKSVATDQKFHPKTTAQSWIIWGAAALFYLYEMVLRVTPNVITESLMRDFKITSTQLGLLVSFYYYAYTALQIPCGGILDKIGARRLITISSLACTLGALTFALTNSLFVAQCSRFLIGAGSACAFIGCLKVTTTWFSPHQFALIAGLTNMMGSLGGTFAGQPVAILSNMIGWRNLLISMGFFGILVTALCWFFIRDPKTEAKDASQEQSVSVLNGFFFCLKHKQIWLSGVVGGLMYLPISVFCELWGVPFLMNSYNINNEKAASIMNMIFIGVALGSSFSAFLTDQIKSHKKVMMLSSLLTGFFFFLISYCHFFSLNLMYLIAFLAGFSTGGQVLCFTISRYNAPGILSGSAAAFTNTVVMLSGIIFQPLLGKILDFFWKGHLTPEGVRFYDQECYRYAIMTIPLCITLSLFLAFFLKETYKDAK
jgi:MFS family permease